MLPKTENIKNNFVRSYLKMVLSITGCIYVYSDPSVNWNYVLFVFSEILTDGSKINDCKCASKMDFKISENI